MKSQAQYLAEFEVQLDLATVGTLRRLDQVYRRFCNRIAQNVVAGGEVSPGTPIDTGFARASWWASLNDYGQPHQPAENPEPGKPWNGRADLTALGAASSKDLVYLLSNCAYIEPLENGWSGQAANGFVLLTLSCADIILDQVMGDLGMQSAA